MVHLGNVDFPGTQRVHLIACAQTLIFFRSLPTATAEQPADKAAAPAPAAPAPVVVRAPAPANVDLGPVLKQLEVLQRTGMGVMVSTRSGDFWMFRRPAWI